MVHIKKKNLKKKKPTTCPSTFPGTPGPRSWLWATAKSASARARRLFAFRIRLTRAEQTF